MNIFSHPSQSMVDHQIFSSNLRLSNLAHRSALIQEIKVAVAGAQQDRQRSRLECLGTWINRVRLKNLIISNIKIAVTLNFLPILTRVKYAYLLHMCMGQIFDYESWASVKWEDCSHNSHKHTFSIDLIKLKKNVAIEADVLSFSSLRMRMC